MGVPKFYRWISERYPCLSEVVKEYQLPEFDNLYLDMNGIIHTCSHPDDNNPHFRITEEKIFADVFHYIEVLFRMIKPKKAFFMAVDGVAPRAKMNQQRGRRFRSAREAEELIKQAIQKGETLPKEERFDSNCITPGTEFMARLHEALQYFVVKKVSTDRLWQGPRIYLSGHETPGEGEHKVMDFIRSEKAKVDYDPNTRHCLYGLDADLIMLGLTTHEPHFSLLREEVRFTGRMSQKRSSAPEETTFHLLHLSLMREYLDYEFAELKTTLPFEYNLERIIDDWVLMGFLVGNDFIPHLPHIHIHQECLPLLWSTYKQVLPKLDGYLNEGGFLNLVRFEKYMTTLAQFDMDNFQERYADMKWAEGKMKQLKENVDGAAGHVSKPISYKTSSLSSEKVGIPTATEFMEHKGMNDDGTIVSDDKLLSLDDDDEDEADTGDDVEDDDEESLSELSNDEDTTFASEFKKYKANYYVDKMDFKKVTPAVLQSQSHGYIKAIQWILHYYYNGVQSWSWYYPHHYAPYLSDVKHFSDIKLEFDIGKPFLPFQQLMAVLPTASKNLLPTAFQNLMVDDTSPVIDYYPVNFETDLNGKQQEWEAVVLIPFIDEERLLQAMAPLEQKLLPDEKRRNRHGPHLLYEYTPQSLGIYQSPQVNVFPDIMNSHALITELPMDAFVLPISELRKGLCEGVQDVFYPGFPTLKHIPHTASLTKAGVKVFQMNSRGDNMILHITEQPPLALETLAKELIGRSVLVGWPHLFEAFVVAVSDDETRIALSDMGGHSEATSGDRKNLLRHESLHMDESAVWHREVDSLAERYMNRWGTDVGTTQRVVYAKPISGRRYICSFQGNVTLERQWQAKPEPFLGQTVVKDIAVFNQSFCQFKTLEELFLPKTKVFLLGNPHYGCAGEVLDVEKSDDARIRVSFTVPVEPDLAQFRQNKGGSVVRYFPAYSLAQRLGITPHLLSRITGTVYLTQNGLEEGKSSNRINIGLNLKYNKTNKEVPGYTRKVDNDWQYSNKVADILANYIEGFPEVFDCIRTSNQNNIYLADDVFKANKTERILQLTAYLKTLACAHITPVSQGTLQVDDEIVKEIETQVSRVQEQNKRKKRLIKMLVRPHLLYQPLEAQAMLIPDANATYELFDRVINIRDGYSVPLGFRGTVIGILPASKEQEIIYEVLFDEEFIDGLTIRSSPNRAYQMPSYAMINITFGERKDMHRGHQPNTSCNAGQGPWKMNADQLDRRNAGHQQKERPNISHSAANFPVPQVLSRPAQNKDPELYEDMWNQLKGQQNSPAKLELGHNAIGAAVGKSSVPTASSLQPLHPPQAWIQSSRDQRNLSGGQPSPKTKLEKTTGTAAQREANGLKGTDAGKPSAQLITPREEKIDSSKPNEMRANRTVKETSGTMRQAEASGELSQCIDQPPASYGLPVKLDDLFKGLRECCHLHDQPELMQNKSLDIKLHPDADQSHPEDPVASLTPSFISLMPPGIRPTTLAPYEAEQGMMQALGLAGHQQQLQQQQQSRAPVVPHAQQPLVVQPQQLIMPGASWPVQPLMSVPLAQPVRSLLGPLPNQPLQQQQHFRAPPTPNMGNSVSILASYCHSKGMPEPQYHVQTGSDGRFRFFVYLQGGVKFVGSWAKQRDQAAESAASVTIYHLNLSAKKTLFPVGPEFMSSPNSAFTRVQTFQGNHQSNLPVQGMMPGFNMHPQNMAGFPVRSLPGFMNQQFAPFAYHPKDARGSVQPNNHFANVNPGNGDRFLNPAPKEQRSAKSKTDWEEKKMQSSSKDDEARDAASACFTNQFIPTQVLRQNKVPQKMRLSNEDVGLASSAEQPTNVGLSQNHSSSGYQGSIRKEAACEDSAVAACFSTALPPRTSKRTRSRIAANFNLNKDQDPSVSQ